MELNQAMKLRQSTRSFKTDQIKDDELKAILDAAYLAPVGMGQYENTQLLVVQDPEILKEFNDQFGPVIEGKKMMPTYGAPTVIFVIDNKEYDAILSGANAGVIIENMTLAACQQGVASCFLLGCAQGTHGNPDAAAKLFNLPEGFQIEAGLALGYPTSDLNPRKVQDNQLKTNYLK